MSPTDVSAIDDVRIDGINDLVAPNEIISRYPVSEVTTSLIRSTRAKIAAIMRGDDERLLVVIGPCSIHDSEAGTTPMSGTHDRIIFIFFAKKLIF